MGWPMQIPYGPQGGYAWAQADMVHASPDLPISVQAHKNHTKSTGLGPDMGSHMAYLGPDISAVGMLGAYL